MDIYLLSHRGLVSSVSYDPLFELEDIMVTSCGGKLLVPNARGVTQWLHEHPGQAAKPLNKVINRTIGPYKLVNESFLPSSKQSILFIIALCGSDLNGLSCLPGWRQHFEVVVAYIFDAWDFHIYPKYIHHIDHVFVPMPELIDSFRKHFSIPISLLPFGCDVLTHGSAKLNRPFDLISYGRIPEGFHRAFTKKFNQPGSGRIYYRFTPRSSEKFPKHPYEDRRDKEDRMFLFKILRRTKIALAFDTMYPGMRKFPYSFVTLRWFESGAAGCVVIGKRPTTPLADQLLNWEDATIELPDDPQESANFVEELLQDRSRLHSIHKRNYVENLAQHDWRFRIKSMLEQLGIPLPKRLVEELSQLKILHAQASQ